MENVQDKINEEKDMIRIWPLYRERREREEREIYIYTQRPRQRQRLWHKFGARAKAKMDAVGDENGRWIRGHKDRERRMQSE